MNIFQNNKVKPRKIWLVQVIHEGQDYRSIDKAFNFKCEAKRYCDYMNNTYDEGYWDFEEVVLY